MNEEIATVLKNRLNKPDIDYIVTWIKLDDTNRESIFNLALGGEGRMNANALWCLTHLSRSDKSWLQSRQDRFIDRLLTARRLSVRRMLLQILREQDYTPDTIRTDFLDFCLSRINSEAETYAIRCFSLYTAYKMCRCYPELIAELEEHLTMLGSQTLSPGMKCALRKVSTDIRRLRP